MVAGESVATVAGSGLAAASPGDTVEVNVGFASERGHTAASTPPTRSSGSSTSTP